MIVPVTTAAMLLFILIPTESQAAPSACSAAKMQEILAAPQAAGHSVVVDCNLTLQSTDVVGKALNLEGPNASGVTVNCNGAVLDGTISGNPLGRNMIYISPKKVGGVWVPPENVTFNNCVVKGMARLLWGDHLTSGVTLPGNNVDYEIYNSSRTANHTAHMQLYAPKNIKFNKMTFDNQGGGNTVYIGPGATRVTIIDSIFKGETTGAAIYLESESGHNLIKNNRFDILSHNREIISVDASANNTIINNTFTKLQVGGIFLYRNCGEQGVIRHQGADNNTIVNNIFDYTDTPNPRANKFGIHISSRTGLENINTDKYYCDEDDDTNNEHPYGSSVDDGSPARNNIVAQNRFIGKTVSQQLVVSNGYSIVNRENTSGTSAPARLAGCYVKNGSPDDFISHGQTVTSFLVGGTPTCTGKKVTCTDGVSTQTNYTCPVVPKNVCYIDINTSNRMAVRHQNGEGQMFYNLNQVTQANAFLNQEIAAKTCDPTSKPWAAQACTLTKNNANRWVIRLPNDQGLFYFASSEKSLADAKLAELKTWKICK